MKKIKLLEQFLLEKKPKGAPDWHDSDAPDAEGRFRDLGIKDLAAWLIKTRDKDLKKITGSLNQQIVFNRNDDKEYADKMEKVRKEVYKQLGREDLLKEERDTLAELNEMTLGQLERIEDYAEMIEERMESGQQLESWMYSQITIALENLNAVHDALAGEEEVDEDRDWNDKRRGPHPYTATLSPEDEEKKEKQMKKQAEMDDDDPDAYKEMPGSEEAREKGKVKTSKHVKRYHQLYGDKKDESVKEGKKEQDMAENIFSDLLNNYEPFELQAMSMQDAKETVMSYDEVPASMITKVSKALLNLAHNFDYEDFFERAKTITFESPVNEKAEGDRGPIDDDAIETALKNKSEETGVPIQFLRIVMRRGMAAWRTGHRPGATQQQWGYARVNSFLTKQPGTWGGADSDVAKEVRDGGHDKDLKS